MKKRYNKKPLRHVTLAKQHIHDLFKEAKAIYKIDKKLANRYVFLARKIAMKFKVKIPKEYKRRFCKHCYTYLVPGDNCKVRTSRGNVVYYCYSCKKYMKIGYH